MGLFGFGSGKKKSNVGEVAHTTPAHVAEEKRVSLEKHKVSLEKMVVSLEKQGLLPSGHKARVVVVMDYSGSMGSLYRTGAVSKLMLQVLPLGLRFDDDGEMDFWIFQNDFEQLESLNANNYMHIDSIISHAKMDMGGTKYAPILKELHKIYAVQNPSETPTYVLFVTDGEPSDAEASDRVLREICEDNIFVQFLGIGDEDFKYLKKIDNLSGRSKDNTSFSDVSDIRTVYAEELYKEILHEYPQWLRMK